MQAEQLLFAATCVFARRLPVLLIVRVIDDTTGTTLVAANSLDKEFKADFPYGGNIEAARAVGELVAKRALAKGIDTVVFDRGGNIYHGRVKALAEGAREAGLKF